MVTHSTAKATSGIPAAPWTRPAANIVNGDSKPQSLAWAPTLSAHWVKAWTPCQEPFTM